jgi:dihydrofolate synthase/folylpolyglutamate synthase
MTYEEAISFLYDKLPMFTQVGSQAYRPGLGNIIHICNHLNNPQDRFKSIHVAGTNGKGSTSHSLASILQCEGYKTGLYTSPHLKNFTERIRINGIEVSREFVAEFVKQHKGFIETCKASFFEVTTAMAFDYFAKSKVDIAIIETGLGGRLDSTNIIHPILSIITNIGYDHTDILGDTLEKIAFEKAGIIKSGVPAVISERQKETSYVFIAKSKEVNAPIYFTDDIILLNNSYKHNEPTFDLKVNNEVILSNIRLGLAGNYQVYNLKGVIKSTLILQSLNFSISNYNLLKGLLEVNELTGLKGRWQTLKNSPLTICDTGHNKSGIKEIVEQLKSLPHRKLWMILGFVKDKDISGILKLLPRDANYVFCQANIPRALNATELALKASEISLNGQIISNVNDAIIAVNKLADKEDVIFIGGSTFLVAEIEGL